MSYQILDIEDLAYIAALISHIKKNPGSKSSQFSKNLILITIGVVRVNCFEETGRLTFVQGYDDLVEDYIDNFIELYPHYFENNNPVFSLVVCSIIDDLL